MLRDQPVLREDHVVVVVLREARAQAVRGLGGFTGADGVRQDEVVAAGVQRLPGTEELTRECGVSMPAPDPVVPCRMSTGSPVGAPTVV
mgnify:CR=1 FL=1